MSKTIGIAGLGLIGGSMAKAIKKHTNYTVTGFDISSEVISKALSDGAIDILGSIELFHDIDILFIALFPKHTVDFVKSNIHSFKKGCIIVDLCGVKQYVCEQLGVFCKEHGVVFIGGHPMAGRELSGYDNSLATLFDGASMILTPTEGSTEQAVSVITDMCYELGFGKVVITTPENHDKMIAFTSQLAHVVSNAYIKSPEATEHSGYSAGSYKDLTRVAQLNEVMWSELFLCNQKSLVSEIDTLINNLAEYRDAIAQNNRPLLQKLLKDGSDRKKQIDRS